MNNYIVKDKKTYRKTEEMQMILLDFKTSPFVSNKFGREANMYSKKQVFISISDQFFFMAKQCIAVTHHMQRNCLDK